MNYNSALHLVSLTIFFLLIAGCQEAPPTPLTFTTITSPTAEGGGQAHLSAGPGGDAILSWLEPTATGATLKFSMLVGDGWSDARTVAEGDNWFVNWADIPSVEYISDDLWAAHWLRNRADSYHSYDALMSLSIDGGENWQDPLPIHLDGTETEHGFATLFPLNDGLGAVWLDGRNFIVDGEYEFEDKDGNPVGTSLRYASFTSRGERLGSSQLDELVCDCCQTDVAITAEGPVVAYRDRTPQERRDIVVLRMQDAEWQDPVALDPDNWVIDGCPINGPAIAANGNDVAVAWFSGADERPHVRLAHSGHAGRDFDAAVTIDTEGSYGYVDVALLESGESIVSWMRKDGEGIALVIRLVSASGQIGEIQTVTRMDTGRPADFPQMVTADGRLVFAWTEPGEPQMVKTAVADLSR